MSSGAGTSSGAHTKTAATRLQQLVGLIASYGICVAVSALAPHWDASAALWIGLGLLLLWGLLTSELLETVGLPHLTGYLLAGVVAGPHVLHLVSHDTVGRLQPVSGLAMSLIALAGGLELHLDQLRQDVRSLLRAHWWQSVLGLGVAAGALCALARFVPFLRPLPLAAIVGVAILWGILAVSRSPSATLAILAAVAGGVRGPGQGAGR
jgi:Kef-type K+ transport system membrane component KefB